MEFWTDTLFATCFICSWDRNFGLTRFLFKFWMFFGFAEVQSKFRSCFTKCCQGFAKQFCRIGLALLGVWAMMIFQTLLWWDRVLATEFKGDIYPIFHGGYIIPGLNSTNELGNDWLLTFRFKLVILNILYVSDFLLFPNGNLLMNYRMNSNGCISKENVKSCFWRQPYSFNFPICNKFFIIKIALNMFCLALTHDSSAIGCFQFIWHRDVGWTFALWVYQTSKLRSFLM